jgi:hypothetical protein
MVRSTLVVMALLVGCKGDAPNEERKLPHLHPPPSVQIPPDVRIPVEVDGRHALDIDAALLRATAPTFADADRVAWRLEALMPGRTGSGTEFVAEGGKGVSVAFRAQSAQVPVLLLNRRGEILVQGIDPMAPFPGYHGAGSRLGRPPREVPHVAEVARIVVRRSSQVDPE